ncbi:MAG: hypothetical protein K8S99_06830 [Planctomycetes bacterium]|nr:hypothetical protein [Planctomycetota bacterium]
MPGSITLPQVVLDLEEEDRKKYEALSAPKSIVVRYGSMKMVAELPYDGDAKPGCGSKLVIRSRRGIELGEMLTTTCGNGGCGKNITRKQMLEYIDNSGGRDYPFTNEGRVLRVATVEDLNEQMRLDGTKMPMIRMARQVTEELALPMKVVDVELLLGGERVIFHYTSETWIDFRELVRRLAAEYHTRIEMHQVNARDEARLTADYEKCGQHCCCKQFLKVLKPVSMRSAKVQKATLDPTKISGRCGRLMCCLRYEDQTYEELRKRLPNRQTRVMTADGPGTVIDTQILTQLALVRLDKDPKPAAYPLENIEILAKDHPNYRPPPPPLTPEERAAERAQGRAGGAGSAPPAGPGAPRPPRDDRGGRPNDRPQRNEPRRPTPGAPLRGSEVESREGTRSDALPGEPRDITNNPKAGGGAAPPTGQPAPFTDADHGSDEPMGDEGPDDGGDEATSPDGNIVSDGNNAPGAQGNSDAPGTPGAPGEPGSGRRKRRRRRRGRGGRGRGDGQGGGPGPGPSGGGGGGAPSGPPPA